MFIQPSTQYLAVSLDKQEYFVMNTNQFEKCIQYSPFQYICKQLQPLYVASQRQICEIKMFSTIRQIPEGCDKRLTQIDLSVFTQLSVSNSWIYVVPDFEVITIICENSTPRDVTLSGTGKIWLSQTCVGYSGTVTLIPHGKIMKANLSLEYIPQINLQTNLEKPRNFELIVADLKLNKNYKTVTKNLENLKINSHKLNEIEKLATTMETNLENNKFELPNHPHITITIGVILILVILTLIGKTLISVKRRLKISSHSSSNKPSNATEISTVKFEVRGGSETL